MHATVVASFCALLAAPAAVAANPVSIVDLQRFRSVTSVPMLPDGSGVASLVDLQPQIGAWYLLRLTSADGSERYFHIENPFPGEQQITLDPDRPGGFVIVAGDDRSFCDLWRSPGDRSLAAASKSKRPFVGLCDDKLFLRNPSIGHRTRKEWATDLLRDRVRHGDRITNFIKEKLYRDRYLRTSKSKLQAATAAADESADGPARLRAKPGAASLSAGDLNLVVRRESDGGVLSGRWYAVDGYPGIYVSTMTASRIADEVVHAQQGFVNALDPVESQALVFLVAFDLSMFEVGFALGTEHPRVGWSDRVPETSRVAGLRGPDGLDSIAPLARTGKLNPWQVDRVAATFSGGFKRTHGAFKWGSLSLQNRGSHYGFVENGVVLSTLQPGLATFVVYDDGRVDLKTWTTSNADSLRWIRHARQNGVPLLEPDPKSGVPRAGALVRQWGAGNWSGSQDQQLRTLRAGACVQETAGGRFLIYGYFTSVTPSAMALMFDACGCRYAMHLDMNAPEHTYLALYRVQESKFMVQRLVREMAEVDPTVDGQELPRYVGYSDNRDFFYLLRKDGERP